MPTAILPESSKKQGTRPRSGRNAPAGGDSRASDPKAQHWQAPLQATAEGARCLEEQLAQRDARIAELEVQISNLNEKNGRFEKNNDTYVSQAEEG